MPQHALIGLAEIEIEEHEPECIAKELVHNIEGHPCTFASPLSASLYPPCLTSLISLYPGIRSGGDLQVAPFDRLGETNADEDIGEGRDTLIIPSILIPNGGVVSRITNVPTTLCIKWHFGR